MKKNAIIKYGVSMLAIIVLVVGAVNFPKIYSYKRDSRDFNKVYTYEQDKLSLYINNAAVVRDRIKGLVGVLSKDMEVYYVVMKEDVNDEQDIVRRILEEINKMTECGLIPDLSAYDLENNCIIKCKGISGNDNEEDFKYWSVEFTDFKENYNFTFIVDYETYMIYHAALESYMLNEWIDSKYYLFESDSSELSSAYIEYYLPDEIRRYVTDDNTFNIHELIYDDKSLFFTNIVDSGGKDNSWRVGVYELFKLDESMDYY